MLRWLVCGRLRPVWMRKALLLFGAIAFASQLLRVIFNKSVLPAPHSISPCQPHTHIMFLKTHKTASSTVLNMLNRFGEERNLTFALPMSYRFDYPLPFNAHTVKGYQGPRAKEFHIMGNHMRFDKPEVEKVMPEDTFYFSIIREPVSLAESSFDYFKDLAPAYRNAKGLGDFADDPKKYYDPRVPYNHLARNPLWFDFGMDNNANFSMALAQRGEAMIRQAFKLILMSEYFDQSMILLRHALCWPLDAVVSFRLNARQQKPSGIGVMGGSRVGKAAAGVSDKGGNSQAKMLPNLPLTEEQRERLRQWNALDCFLYKAFNQTFWEEIQRFGLTEMEQEVALLRARRDVLTEVCLRDGGKPVEAHQIQDKAIRPFQPRKVNILGYELQPGLDNATRTACLRMLMPENRYKDVLDAKQFLRDSAAHVQPGQQSQGQVVSAGGSFLKQDSSRTGETLVGGEVGGRTVAEGDRDWDASHSIRTNQTLMQGKEKEG